MVRAPLLLCAIIGSTFSLAHGVESDEKVDAYTNRTHFPLRFTPPPGVELLDLSDARLHWTRDGGRTWHEIPIAQVDWQDGRFPLFEVRLEGPGRYGFISSYDLSAGKGRPPPQSGDKPEHIFEIDTNPPEILVFAAEIVTRDGVQELRLSWDTEDDNPAKQPVHLEASLEGQTWHTFAQGLNATGLRRVPVTDDRQPLLRLVVKDRAGNRSISAPMRPGEQKSAQPKEPEESLTAPPPVASNEKPAQQPPTQQTDTNSEALADASVDASTDDQTKQPSAVSEAMPESGERPVSAPTPEPAETAAAADSPSDDIAALVDDLPSLDEAVDDVDRAMATEPQEDSPSAAAAPAEPQAVATRPAPPPPQTLTEVVERAAARSWLHIPAPDAASDEDTVQAILTSRRGRMLRGDQAQAVLDLARELAQAERFAAARPYYQRLGTSTLASAARADRAIIAIITENDLLAEQLALEAPPYERSSELMLAAAFAQARRGRKDAAVQTLYTITPQNPHYRQAQLIEALAHQRAGKPEEATAILRHLAAGTDAVAISAQRYLQSGPR